MGISKDIWSVVRNYTELLEVLVSFPLRSMTSLSLDSLLDFQYQTWFSSRWKVVKHNQWLCFYSQDMNATMASLGLSCHASSFCDSYDSQLGNVFGSLAPLKLSWFLRVPWKVFHREDVFKSVPVQGLLKHLNKIKQATVDYGPTSPYTITLIDGLTDRWMTPYD